MVMNGAAGFGDMASPVAPPVDSMVPAIGEVGGPPVGRPTWMIVMTPPVVPSPSMVPSLVMAMVSVDILVTA